MKYPKAEIIRLLINYFGNDNRRIEHALKVLYHAEKIMETRDDYDPDIVIASALLHDVGIKISEQKLNYNNGKTQEKFGPPEVGKLLNSIYFPPDKITIVKNIVGNHHSPSKYDYSELEILKEADKIVNKEESNL